MQTPVLLIPQKQPKAEEQEALKAPTKYPHKTALAVLLKLKELTNGKS